MQAATFGNDGYSSCKNGQKKPRTRRGFYNGINYELVAVYRRGTRRITIAAASGSRRINTAEISTKRLSVGFFCIALGQVARIVANQLILIV